MCNHAEAHVTNGWEIDICLIILICISSHCLSVSSRNVRDSDTISLRSKIQLFKMGSKFIVSNFQIANCYYPQTWFFFFFWMNIPNPMFLYFFNMNQKFIKICHGKSIVQFVCKAGDKFWICNSYGRVKFNGLYWLIE